MEVGRLKGVLFDMDGVILDSEELWDHITEKIVRKYSLDMSVLMENDGFNLSADDAMRLVLDSMGCYTDELHYAILEYMDEVYFGCLGTMTSLEDGISDVLETLYSKGLSAVLVSNSTRKQVVKVLEHYGLEKYFTGIVAADDVKNSKPHAEPYLKALSLSGLRPEEVIVVEDSPTGIRSAENASLPYVMVSGKNGGNNTVLRTELGSYLMSLC